MLENLTVEYLVILKNQGSFCNSIKAFNNLLKAHGDIDTSVNKLKYKKFEVDYIINTGIVEDKEQRFFDITLSSNKDEVTNFVELLKVLREIIHKSGGSINIIWDEISFYYAVLSYPIINQIENLLRKLISKFMLTTVGIEWEQETLPENVKTVISKAKRSKNSYVNILHETDFIHLADFLFKPYSKKSTDELFKTLKDDLKNSKTTEYDDFIPKSNWERYFSKLVNCEDGYLNKQWQKLYELRCLVAHNNFVSITEYDELVNISKELETTFNDAIKNLDKIKIDNSDKSILIENALIHKNVLFNTFISKWHRLQLEVKNIAIKSDLINVNDFVPFTAIIKILAEHSIISDHTLRRLLLLRQIRNKIMQGEDLDILEEGGLVKHLLMIDEIINLLTSA